MAENAAKGAFIAANLKLQPVAFVPEISIYTAHPGSRLSRLGDVPPYWAYAWAGGAGLARFVLDRDLVHGLTVLDFGAGSGLVGIAAAKMGARVFAEEADAWGRAAVGMNAAANGVVVSLKACQPELVLCGDVFYGPEVAAGVLPVLDGFRAGGARVLVGDPGRVDLPRDRLELLAEIEVRDMGDGPGRTTFCGVFDYRP